MQVSAPVTGRASRQEVHSGAESGEPVSDIIYIEERGVRCGFKWCKTFGWQSVREG